MPAPVRLALIADAPELSTAAAQRLQTLLHRLDPNRFRLYLYLPEMLQGRLDATALAMVQQRSCAGAPGSTTWRRNLAAALRDDAIEVAHALGGTHPLPAVPGVMLAEQLAATPPVTCSSAWRRCCARRQHAAAQRFVVTTAAAKARWMQYGLAPQRLRVIYDAIPERPEPLDRQTLRQRLQLAEADTVLGFADVDDSGIGLETFAQHCPRRWRLLPLQTITAAGLTPAQALPGLDLLVCPQPDRWLPLILQALAAGCPMVCLECPELDELAGDERAGVLPVPPRRSDLLASACAQILDQRRLRRWLQVSGRQRAAWFEPARMVRGYEELYAGLAADRT